MFTALRQTLWQTPAPSYRQGQLLPDQRIYAIGDIHGRADLLKSLLHKIKTDCARYPGAVTLVVLGDIIDHGPDSAAVVELLSNAVPARWQTVFLKGNHEWAMQQFLADPIGQPQWLRWGGHATLASYGIAVFDSLQRLRPAAALAAELAYAIRAQGHDIFYQDLLPYWRHQGYAFVHAGARRGLPWHDQLETDLLFMRAADFTPGHDLPERIVFGHTIFNSPFITPVCIGIDTGARDSGVLTTAVLEETSLRFLQTSPAR